MFDNDPCRLRQDHDGSSWTTVKRAFPYPLISLKTVIERGSRCQRGAFATSKCLEGILIRQWKDALWSSKGICLKGADNTCVRLSNRNEKTRRDATRLDATRRDDGFFLPNALHTRLRTKNHECVFVPDRSWNHVWPTMWATSRAITTKERLLITPSRTEKLTCDRPFMRLFSHYPLERFLRIAKSL